MEREPACIYYTAIPMRIQAGQGGTKDVHPTLELRAYISCMAARRGDQRVPVGYPRAIGAGSGTGARYGRRKSARSFFPFFGFAQNPRYLVKTLPSINAATETPIPYMNISYGSKVTPKTSIPKN